MLPGSSLALSLSSIRVFSNESAVVIRWPECWSFSFSPSPFNEYSGLISFRIDWFDLLAVQRTLKSLLQHHSFKASFLQCSAFLFLLSHLCMTTGKAIALTVQIFCQWIDVCFLIHFLGLSLGFSRSSVGKESASNAGDLGSSPESGRSPGKGNGNPLQYSCLENPMDRGAWQATVHGVSRVRHDLATKPHYLGLS